jgi:general secretion pathway protein G
VLQHIHERRERRVATGNGSGFTLIELLVIVVVLGVLASVVMVALSSEAASTAQAACNADAKTVELAVEAFHNNPMNTAAGGQFPAVGATGQVQLTDPASDSYGGPYMRTWPSNPGHYAISLDGTVKGQVDVTPAGSVTPQNYDGATNPCTSVS